MVNDQNAISGVLIEEKERISFACGAGVSNDSYKANRELTYRFNVSRLSASRLVLINMSKMRRERAISSRLLIVNQREALYVSSTKKRTKRESRLSRLCVDRRVKKPRRTFWLLPYARQIFPLEMKTVECLNELSQQISSKPKH